MNLGTQPIACRLASLAISSLSFVLAPQIFPPNCLRVLVKVLSTKFPPRAIFGARAVQKLAASRKIEREQVKAPLALLHSISLVCYVRLGLSVPPNVGEYLWSSDWRGPDAVRVLSPDRQLIYRRTHSIFKTNKLKTSLQNAQHKIFDADAQTGEKFECQPFPSGSKGEIIFGFSLPSRKVYLRKFQMECRTELFERVPSLISLEVINPTPTPSIFPYARDKHTPLHRGHSTRRFSGKQDM